MTLRRYKVASLLNVLGLTLAFVAFYIIASQVYYSISYNRPIEDSDRIYLVSAEWGSSRMGDAEESWSLNCPQPVSYETKELCPDVELMASMRPSADIGRVWVKRDNYNFDKFDISVHLGNANVVELFNFEAVAGDLSRVVEPNTVVVAESAAEQMGIGVGDDIWLEGGQRHNDGKPTEPQQVVAIYKDFPKNSFLHHRKIFQNDNLAQGQTNNNWNYSCFVRLKEGADTEAFCRIWSDQYAKWFLAMVEEFKREYPEEEDFFEEGDELQPVRLIRLDKMYYESNIETYDNYYFAFGSKAATATLAIIGLVIVIIAFINFVNFFFALVPVRMRAVNICKVFGASQGTLRWNFLFEAIGLVLISMALTFYLMIAIQESFITNFVTSSLALSDNLPVIAVMIVLMVLLAVVAALYPAFFITRFNASLGVKGGFAQSAAGRRLRSVMVGVQFTVAMVLIIITGVFFLQYRYMINYDLGFDRSNIVTFADYNLTPKAETIIERLQQHPDVEDVTASRMSLFHCMQGWGREYDGHTFMLMANEVRWNFLDFFGFELVDGEGFTPSSAERKEIIIMRQLHLDTGYPLGMNSGSEYNTIGIIKDVRLSSVAQPNQYHSFYCGNEPGFFYIRLIEGADVKAFAKYVKELTKEFSPLGEGADLYYLNQWVEMLYQTTKQQLVTIGLFAILAVVIALMGVFGIVMFETQHRRSEIAVRKVYGATTRQIVEMLNLRYVWIVGGCFVVAAPVAWYITSRWLEQFANRIAQPWWLYIAALVIVLAVTVGLVTLRSWKAATENPADVVKSN
ncbi:MAG: ABC transporter permease [Lachnospiraceae bacterium]|nr:ABC transporter permease [Lachnospiraceae bacterium]